MKCGSRTVLAVTLMLGLAGCDGKSDGLHNAITGEVKIDGVPIERGSILFTPMDGVKGQTVGGPIENGRYTLAANAGPAAGLHRVEIRGIRKTGRMVQKPLAPPGEMVEVEEEAVAARFNKSSSLTFDVKAGANTADFPVSAK